MLWKILSLSYRIYRAQTHSNSHIERGVTCSYPYHLVGRLKLSLSLCTFHQLQTQHFHIHNFISLSPIQKINITPRLTLLKSQTSGTLSKRIYQVHEKRVANGEKANLNVTRAHDYPSRSQAHRFRRDCVCVFENLNGKNILILIKAFRC